MERLKRYIRRIFELNIPVYASQASFFIVLSVFPTLVLLMGLLRYTGLGAESLTEMLHGILPTALMPAAQKLIMNTYQGTNSAVLSISAVTALWSASRGIVALTRGLNRMYGLTESRNYFLLRFFAFAETLILEIALICTLGGAVQGNLLNDSADGAVLKGVLRTVAGFVVLTVFFLFLYIVLPDHSPRILPQLPGAAGAAAGWILFTEGYSFYVEKIADFPRLYGALSNGAMLMLWLWLCLCILFLGAFLNRVLSSL